MVENERVRFLHYIRQHELEASLAEINLPPGSRILDFGGGDGFTAKIMDEMGYDVTAVDLFPRLPGRFPVIQIGSPDLPFGDDSFDMIFSSNVMEHVQDIPGTLAELKRVLRPDSYCVFTMPTPVWRFFSLIELPLSILVNRRRPKMFELQGGSSATSSPPQAKKKGNIIMRGIKYISRPHGEFPSAFHELITFSEGSWRGRFEANNYTVDKVKAMPVFYTAAMFFPNKFLSLRRVIPNRYTASCLAYCVKPKDN